MAATGVALWVAAHLTLFHLYLPNRHTRTTLGVFGIVVLAVALTAVFEWLVTTRRANVREGALQRTVALVAPLVVLAAFLPSALPLWRKPVDRDLERTYEYLASLPKDTLIGADPNLADFVPLRTGRAVLASSETALPFMVGYYARMKPRVEASMRAAYAADWPTVDAELGRYGVDVMLTGPLARQPQEFLPPFDALARELGVGDAARHFVGRNPPADRVLFHSGAYYVVRIGPAPERAP